MAVLAAAKFKACIGDKLTDLSVKAVKIARLDKSPYEDGCTTNFINEQLGISSYTEYKFLKYRKVGIS